MITEILGAVALTSIAISSFDPTYKASDGRIYPHKETPGEYLRRHDKLEREKRMRRYTNKLYKASDGRIYSHKETPAEYYTRKLRNSR